jgi:hypothetical protein
MTFPSRRSLLQIVGLIPGLAAVPLRFGHKSAVFESKDLNLGEKQFAFTVVGAWLIQNGVTLGKLDRLDGGTGQPTTDLRQSFHADPLVGVSGVLLPTGFCRYCILIARPSHPRPPAPRIA